MHSEVLFPGEPRGDELCNTWVSPPKQRPVAGDALGQSIPVGVEPAPGERQRHHECDEKHDSQARLSDVALEERQALTKDIPQRAEQRRPRDTAHHVVESEDSVRHLGRTCEQSCPGSKKRYEPSEKHGLWSVTVKERANAGQLLVVEMDQPSVTLQKRQPAKPADPVAGSVASNSTGRGDCDHPPDRQVAQRGERAGCHQHRLARKGNAETLYGDEQKDDGVAVRFNELNYRSVHG